ncbi:unnamed protein product [Prorocentrum cordatum]|uniref:Uncharacterized protein n=1 Tax=Prorocentrum cordatum TaxID=2364126 RepID=A0ABN9U2I3_9DINO|nr:unnamed protein product [Polarella glacialis]
MASPRVQREVSSALARARCSERFLNHRGPSVILHGEDLSQPLEEEVRQAAERLRLLKDGQRASEEAFPREAEPQVARVHRLLALETDPRYVQICSFLAECDAPQPAQGGVAGSSRDGRAAAGAALAERRAEEGLRRLLAGPLRSALADLRRARNPDSAEHQLREMHGWLSSQWPPAAAGPPPGPPGPPSFWSEDTAADPTMPGSALRGCGGAEGEPIGAAPTRRELGHEVSLSEAALIERGLLPETGERLQGFMRHQASRAAGQSNAAAAGSPPRGPWKPSPGPRVIPDFARRGPAAPPGGRGPAGGAPPAERHPPAAAAEKAQRRPAIASVGRRSRPAIASAGHRSRPPLRLQWRRALPRRALPRGGAPEATLGGAPAAPPLWAATAAGAGAGTDRARPRAAGAAEGGSSHCGAPTPSAADADVNPGGLDVYARARAEPEPRRPRPAGRDSKRIGTCSCSFADFGSDAKGPQKKADEWNRMKEAPTVVSVAAATDSLHRRLCSEEPLWPENLHDHKKKPRGAYQGKNR